MAIYIFKNNKNLHFIKDPVNDLEVVRDLPNVLPVELLDSPMLGSPLHSGGLCILDLREPSDDHYWL